MNTSLFTKLGFVKLSLAPEGTLGCSLDKVRVVPLIDLTIVSSRTPIPDTSCPFSINEFDEVRVILVVPSAVVATSAKVPFSIVAALYSSFMRDTFICVFVSAVDKNALSSVSVPVLAKTNTVLFVSKPVIIKSF